FFLYPADYYGTVLAPVVLAAFAAPAFALGFMGLMAGLWVARAALPPPLDVNVELAHWWASLAIAAFAVLWLGHEFSPSWRERDDAGRVVSTARRAKAARWAAAIGSVAILGAVGADIQVARRPPEADRAGVVDVDLIPRDVVREQGTTVSSQAMMQWGSGWT